MYACGSNPYLNSHLRHGHVLRVGAKVFVGQVQGQTRVTTETAASQVPLVPVWPKQYHLQVPWHAYCLAGLQSYEPDVSQTSQTPGPFTASKFAWLFTFSNSLWTHVCPSEAQAAVQLPPCAPHFQPTASVQHGKDTRKKTIRALRGCLVAGRGTFMAPRSQGPDGMNIF